MMHITKLFGNALNTPAACLTPRYPNNLVKLGTSMSTQPASA